MRVCMCDHPYAQQTPHTTPCNVPVDGERRDVDGDARLEPHVAREVASIVAALDHIAHVHRADGLCVRARACVWMGRWWVSRLRGMYVPASLPCLLLVEVVGGMWAAAPPRAVPCPQRPKRARQPPWTAYPPSQHTRTPRSQYRGTVALALGSTLAWVSAALEAR